MCGIAGVVSADAESNIDETLVRRMCAQIRHRGPDDEGIWVEPGAGIGMRRLSIIDLAGGHQPVFNEDNSVGVVLNGEIYNFLELRRELLVRGHRFRTSSDTEVIVHLYEEVGAECVQRLRGMFAFAVFDTGKRKLLLARDRFGKKPLHYARDGGKLYFASEIKAILEVAPQLAEINSQGLLDYLYYGYVPDPITAYRRIHKLPPGHVLEFQNGNACIREYWTLPRFSDSPVVSEEECLEEMERRLEEAVRLRLVSDVPVGAFLSGGIDSSTVVALMARVSSAAVKTFSIGFTHEKFNEAADARRIAQLFCTDHEELILQPDVAETLQTLTSSMEEPFGDSSMLPTYYVSKLARQHVTVALSGDGGDEMFAGYDRYRVHSRRRIFENLPEWSRRFYRKRVYPAIPSRWRSRKFAYNIALSWQERFIDGLVFIPGLERQFPILSAEFRSQLASANDPRNVLRLCFERAPATDAIDQMLYVDAKTYLAGDILTKVDRMSMLNSLEVRAPLLDHIFAEWAVALPTNLKLRNGVRQKYLLRRLAERLGVPREIVNARKRGFGIPLDDWMRSGLEGLLMVLLEPRTLQRGYFDPVGVRRLMELHISGKQSQSEALWRLLMFELWHRNYLDKLRGTSADASVRDLAIESEKADPQTDSLVPIPLKAKVLNSRPPIQVTIVAPSLRYVGGQAVQADLLARHWSGDSQVKAQLLVIDPRFPRFLRWAERVRGLRTVIRTPLYLAALWKVLEHTDVAHIFSASYYSFLLAVVPAWLLARLRRKKVLINYRSGEAADHLRRFRSGRFVLSRADRLIVPSGYLVDEFRKFGLDADVVPNIVQTGQFRFRERKPLRPHLLCTRGFSSYYAIDVVVRAFAEVQKSHPNARLDLAGNGPLERQIRELVAELNLANVRFLGAVARSEIARYYDAADIFINASWLDNMPVSILEAFAAGTPVVTTASPSMPYLVEEERTALLSPIGDASALAASVLRLLQEPELSGRLARCGLAELEKYSWEAVRPQWLAVYHGLCMWGPPL